MSWRPISEFDYNQPVRLRWILATEAHNLGELYWGEGPWCSDQVVMASRGVKAWRYTASDRILPEHLKPEFFRPIEPPPNSRSYSFITP